MGRVIGLRHRIKVTAEGEARPTQLAIYIPEAHVTDILELETELDELDFVLGRYPVSFRKIKPEDELENFLSHHVKWRKIRSNEQKSKFPDKFIGKDDRGNTIVATQVPNDYDGLSAGDMVATIFGGSGDMFVCALAERGKEISATVHRIAAKNLSSSRPSDDKSDDAVLLTKLLRSEPALFHEFGPRDASLIHVRETYRVRTDAMKARIQTEQRLRSRLIGQMFRSLSIEGDITQAYDAMKANDKIFQGVLADERRCYRDFEKAVGSTLVYDKIFSGIEGVGPAIAGRIIAAVIDVRRFGTCARFKSFCGVRVRDDGSFLRRRTGMTNNWHNDARQAFWLVADQFNRRANSPWGKILRYYKVKLAERHKSASVPKHMSALFRKAERIFQGFDLGLSIDSYDVSTSEGMLAYLEDGVRKLSQAESSGELTLQLREEIGKLNGKDSTQTVSVFTPGHIHKMAQWRSATKFAEWLYREWTRLEADPASFVARPPNILRFADPQMYEDWILKIEKTDPDARRACQAQANEATRLHDAA
ncbi:MAG: transposase [Candidatus Pacebacteria bacterium]|nr:transposase [Candidatus Paceibacterota bacterium]